MSQFRLRSPRLHQLTILDMLNYQYIDYRSDAMRCDAMCTAMCNAMWCGAVRSRSGALPCRLPLCHDAMFSSLFCPQPRVELESNES